ncbi:MAG: HAMP domain-containing protein [Asgard group archaeon]|nr:HAMP domain-containing protein [Asgard group archaeon]
MGLREFLNSRSIRANIMISFVLLSILFVGGVGGLSFLLFQRAGEQTQDNSEAALIEQITENIQITAEKNAEIINEKLSSAAAMVEYMATELEYVFSPDNRYGDRTVYYDYWFDNTTGNPSLTAPDTHWDSDYQVDLSWTYSSYYFTGSTESNYETLTEKQNQTLETVANMDYAFQQIHTQAPEFRWLYITLPFDGVDLFINYPGSIVGGTSLERLADPWAPSLDDWYLEVLAGDGEIVFTEPYFDPIDYVPLITIGRSVSFDNGTLIGVICGDISIETMVEKILDVKVLETGYAALITDSEAVVAHPEALPEIGTEDFKTISEVEINQVDNSSALTPQDITDITSGDSGILTYTRDGEERFLAYKPVGKGNYISLIILPKAEALEGIQPVFERMTNAIIANSTTIWIIVGVSFVIGITVGLILTSYLIRPITHLVQVARSLSTRRARKDIMEGLMLQIDPKLLKSEDEFGDLTRAFKGMIDSVQQQEREKNN